MSQSSTAPIGILLIGHTPLASALMRCASHVYGSDPPAVKAVDVTPDCDPPRVLQRVKEEVKALDQGRGVLVLTDLFGATPGNIAAQLADAGRVEVLTGVNLPMLLRVLTYRDSSTLEGLIDKATSGATAGVMKIASTAPHIQAALAPSAPAESANQDGADHALARLRDQQ